MAEYTSQQADHLPTENISPGSLIDVSMPSYRSAERGSSMSEESISARGGTGGCTNGETGEGKQAGREIYCLIPTWLSFAAGIFYHMVNNGM